VVIEVNRSGVRLWPHVSVLTTDDKWQRIGGMSLVRGLWSAWSSATLSTINSTQTIMGLNLDLCCQKPATKHLGYGMVIKIVLLTVSVKLAYICFFMRNCFTWVRPSGNIPLWFHYWSRERNHMPFFSSVGHAWYPNKWFCSPHNTLLWLVFVLIQLPPLPVSWIGRFPKCLARLHNN
jgi:hypothetical protein